jgi:phosphoglucosamine mutase
MVEKGVPLSELAGVMPRFPQILVNCPVREKDGWQENPRLAAALEQARKRLGTWGRVLVRASGTEPLIRIMVEGENYDLLHELSSELALMIGEELGQEKQ